MGELALALFLAALAVMAGFLARRIEDRAAALWTFSWIPIIASGALIFASDRIPGSGALVHGLGPLLPALLLAGTLVVSGRRVPGFLLPAAVGLGVVRCLLAATGRVQVSEAIGLVTEPGTLIVAAWLALGIARREEAPLAASFLAPAFLAVAALDGTGGWVALQDEPRAPGQLFGWFVVGPITFGVQLSVAMARVRATQQRVRAALEASEDRFRALTENAFDLISEMSPDGRFTYTNPRFEDVLGYAPGELVGRPSLELTHPDDREHALSWSRARLRDGVGPPLVRVRCRHRDGSWRWIEGSARAFHEVGNTVRLAGVARDVTDQKEMEESLRRAHDQLEERVAERTAQLHEAVEHLEQEIEGRKRVEEERRRLEAHMREVQKLESMGILAGGIAHDFNNLLVVILGNTSLIAADHASEPATLHRVQRIRAAAKHAEALTSQMLTYSGRVSLKRSAVNISHLVEEMGELLDAAVSGRCELETDLAADLPLVEGDPTQIRQVVVNLATNAAEAYEGGPGTVRLRTRRVEVDEETLAESFASSNAQPGAYVVLDVSDSGCGMDGTTRSRIFEPFFTTRSRGSGLGLPAVLGIARSHGGAIQVDSSPGRGTRFRILFPIPGIPPSAS